MRFYGPARWVDYYVMHVIMCARYYTSCCIQQHCQMHFIARSQVSSQDDLKTISSTLPTMLSNTLPIALNDILPGCLTICSQVHSEYEAPKYTSEYILKYTPEHTLKDAPNCTRWDTAILLGCTLQSKLSRRSQAHSRARSQVHSQLHSMTHSQPAWLYTPK